MSEIPEDVMEQAHRTYVKARELSRGGACAAGELIWSPIARAILAERERCANCCKPLENHAWSEDMFVAGGLIADRIRKGG